MAGTFKHLFGGYLHAEARRWRNADGSEGGIVAVSAAVDPSIHLDAETVVWPEARITTGARVLDCHLSAAAFDAAIADALKPVEEMRRRRAERT